MREIVLSKGQICVVDDDDYNRLMQFNWRPFITKHNIYASASMKVDGKHKSVFMHRFILNLTDKNIIIDHKDGNGLNNQKSNLRKCNFSENNINTTSHKGSSSKYVGVSYCEHPYRKKKWSADMQINGNTIRLGRYKTEEEAAIVRDQYIINNNLLFPKLNILVR